jgi:DNA-binding response OmpR family regulator
LATVVRRPRTATIDLGLPEVDGFEVIRRLREVGSLVPNVVLSSRADEAGKVRALDLGADDYLTKPFGVDELFASGRRFAIDSSSRANGRTYLSKLEKGATYVGLEIIGKLATVLEVAPAELLKLPKDMRRKRRSI